MTVSEFAEQTGIIQLEYLGDGLYSGHDGLHIWLMAPRERTVHAVALDPLVLQEFDRYRAKLQQKDQIE